MSKQKKKHAAKAKIRRAQTTIPKPKPWGATWLPSVAWMQALTIRVEYLSELHQIILDRVAATNDELSKKLAKLPTLKLHPDDEYEAEQLIIDDSYTMSSVERWSALLQIVALFHQLEHELGVLFNWILSGLPKPERASRLRSVHRWKDLRTLFKETCACELTKIACYNDVNELRLLSNCVKHTGGRVSSELSDFTKSGAKFQLGSELTEKNVDLGKYRQAVQDFVADFTAKAEAGLQSKFGAARA